MQGARFGEGPWLMRILLVLSSMSPLFVLWAIRGSDLFDFWAFTAACGALFFLPNLFLGALIFRSIHEGVQRTIDVGEAEDRRQDVISYLFAILLPFYTVDLSTWRNLLATVAAFVIVVVLFTSLNLHYMNFLAALGGYHCLNVRPPEGSREGRVAPNFMVITKKSRLPQGSRLTGYLVSSTLMIEARE